MVRSIRIIMSKLQNWPVDAQFLVNLIHINACEITQIIDLTYVYFYTLSKNTILRNVTVNLLWTILLPKIYPSVIVTIGLIQYLYHNYNFILIYIFVTCFFESNEANEIGLCMYICWLILTFFLVFNNIHVDSRHTVELFIKCGLCST